MVSTKLTYTSLRLSVQSGDRHNTNSIMPRDSDSSARARKRRRRRSSSTSASISESEGSESDLSEDEPPENVEITEGGWACYVERYIKGIGPSGRRRYRHAGKHKTFALPPPPPSPPSSSSQQDKNKVKPVIQYFHHVNRKSDEVESYLKIRSPAIWKILHEMRDKGAQPEEVRFGNSRSSY